MTRRLEIQDIHDIIIDELKDRDEKIRELEVKVTEQVTLLNEHGLSIKEQDHKIQILESNTNLQRMFNEYLVRTIDDQNQYQRRQNLIIDGLNIPKNAKDDTIRDIVVKHFKKIKVDVYDEDVVRAHRTGRPFRDSKGKFHVPILCRFVSWLPRNIAHENRKLGKGVYLKADLTERRQELMDDLQNRLKNDERAGKIIQSIFADRNCRITVFTVDGRFFPVNSSEEFELLLNFIESTLPPYDAIFMALHDDGIKEFQKVANILNLNEVEEDPLKVLEADNIKYIGRAKGQIAGSKWANPYSPRVYDLQTCLELYKEHVLNTPALLNDLESLRDLSLACWCTDANLCHGKVLLDLLE